MPFLPGDFMLVLAGAATATSHLIGFVLGRTMAKGSALRTVLL